MRLGKIAILALVGLTGCGADERTSEKPQTAEPGGAGGSGGSGGSGAAGAGGSGGSGGSSAAGTSGTGGNGAGGSGGTAGSDGASGTGSNVGAGGAGGSQPTDTETAAAIANIDTNLERLRALHVVEVKSLIVDKPVGTGNCYGAPCPDEVRGRAAVRLEKLVAVAEFAVQTQYVAARCIERVDTNLAALSSLKIVELGAFLRTAPANNPLCYSLPCPSDVEAADIENEARAADLESIAIAAKPL